jgi:hypothetical protein
MIYAIWHGGHGSYSDPDPDRDVERFAMVEDAAAALESRYGSNRRHTFDYACRESESVFTPGVGRNTFMDVYTALDIDDDGNPLVHHNGPDLRITIDINGNAVVDGEDVE